MSIPIYVVHFKAEAADISEGQNIARQIIESDGQTIDSNYAWKISTKYYNAAVHFVFVSSNDFSKITDTIEAVLFVTPQNVKELTEWYAKAADACGCPDIGPSVALVLEHDTEDTEGDAQKQEILEWCLDNSAEYVHLDQESDEYNKEGVLRVAEALQMNQWSNAVMITQQRKLPNKVSVNESVINNGNNNDADNDNSDDSDGKLDVDGSVPDVPESFMNFEGDDDDGMFDDFDMFGANMEKTIASLQALRSRAQGLPDDQRKELALRVALSFARQMGEDADEFEELVDDSIKLDPECDAAARNLFAGLEMSTKIDCAIAAKSGSVSGSLPQGNTPKKSKKGKKK